MDLQREKRGKLGGTHSDPPPQIGNVKFGPPHHRKPPKHQITALDLKSWSRQIEERVTFQSSGMKRNRKRRMILSQPPVKTEAWDAKQRQRGYLQDKEKLLSQFKFIFFYLFCATQYFKFSYNLLNKWCWEIFNKKKRCSEVKFLGTTLSLILEKKQSYSSIQGDLDKIKVYIIKVKNMIIFCNVIIIQPLKKKNKIKIKNNKK